MKNSIAYTTSYFYFFNYYFFGKSGSDLCCKKS